MMNRLELDELFIYQTSKNANERQILLIHFILILPDKAFGLGFIMKTIDCEQK